MHKTALEPSMQASPTFYRRWASALFGSTSIHAGSIRVATLLLIIVAAGVVPHFTEFGNVQSLMYSVAAVGVGAVGMALVTLSGNLFMLSMGATAAVSTVMFAALIHLGLGVTVLAVVLAGLAIGIVQGAIIALGRANPIITTIATSSIILGAGVLYTGGLTVIGNGDATWLGQGKLFGWLPTQIIVLAVFVIIGSFILQKTRIGREIRLIGMRSEVARIAGLRLMAATLFCYGFAGAAAALAGSLIASSSAQGNLTYGVDLDFNAIAAVLVGGISIRGGRGQISDAVTGAIFLAVISNILLVSGVSYEYQLVVKGMVVLGAVVFGALLARLGPSKK
ncbi:MULTISPECIES: ABC transporter permease [Paraburkholderia]|uniref:ABC transporter permease n=1 Tax=Paraburkholderia guartelaensis TaxID=2546446 RepID=A0A4R5L4K4_9BURK|nr:MULTISPECIES: ABC transporter permease [Paraburkholderia]NUX57628.1 ABC transporter permease [Paraburkholderia youngii]TDG03586.1 ABC transporter permease [Paraburkholderia guartelaensis]